MQRVTFSPLLLSMILKFWISQFIWNFSFNVSWIIEFWRKEWYGIPVLFDRRENYYSLCERKFLIKVKCEWCWRPISTFIPGQKLSSHHSSPANLTKNGTKKQNYSCGPQLVRLRLRKSTVAVVWCDCNQWFYIFHSVWLNLTSRWVIFVHSC